MSYSRNQTQPAMSGSQINQNLSHLAMEELKAAWDVCDRLVTLLDRLRPSPPVGLEKGESASDAPTLQGTIRHIGRAHGRAHELLTEIETFI